MQAKKLFGIDLSEEEAHTIKDTFMDKFFGVATWQMNQVREATARGRIRTPYGKLRKLDKEHCWGAAMNTPVQGGAAECMFIAMVELLKRRGKIPFKLILFVHDELMLECPEKYAQDSANILEAAMYSGYEQLFPDGVTTGLVEAKIGKTWEEVH